MDATKVRPPKLRRKSEREYLAVTPYTVATTVRLPKKLRRVINIHADLHGVSVTEVIITALMEYFERQGVNEWEMRKEAAGANGR